METWKERARRAQEKLETAGHGAREAILDEVADGLNVSTVRRWVFALSFLDLLKNDAPDIWRGLQDASFSELEVLARWHDFDATGALDAAREVMHGRYSSRRLTAAMHKAREMRGGTSRNESFEDIYRRGIERKARGKIEEMLATALGSPEILAKDTGDPPVDFTYETVGGGSAKQIAAIIAGPYRVKNTAFKRRFEWVARAFALAWVFDDVIVLVPDQDMLPEYEKAIRRMRQRVAKAAARAAKPDDLTHRLPNVHALYPGPGPTDVSPSKGSS
jgi:hypothetical protein